MHAGFDVAGGSPMKTRCDPLIRRRFGKEVSGKLFDGELIEGQIRVHGLDHPIAIGPTVTQLIGLKSVGIRIAGKIQPLSSPMFAVSRRIQKMIDHLFADFGRIFRQEVVDLLHTRGQTGQPQAYPAQPYFG